MNPLSASLFSSEQRAASFQANLSRVALEKEINVVINFSFSTHVFLRFSLFFSPLPFLIRAFKVYRKTAQTGAC